ncbi:hypothetical protein tb265_23150 [Gemmatimonadetes bacterium T265]|nr:hypothetical protein tb265_23150 [Gemmatimonadetes bacterium T265]
MPTPPADPGPAPAPASAPPGFRTTLVRVLAVQIAALALLALLQRAFTP